MKSQTTGISIDTRSFPHNYLFNAAVLLVLFFASMAPFSHASAITVYVDGVHGSDTSTCGMTSGTGACASLAKAQLQVRGHAGSTVLIAGNQTYYLPLSPTSPGALSFISSDSGSSGSVITWKANPGTGTPVVSGGEPLSSSLGTWSHTGNGYKFQFTTNPTSFEYLFYTPPLATEPQRRLRARIESNSSSSVGYYMSSPGTCSASNWPSGAGTVPTLTPATCNLGTFLRVIGTKDSSSGCTHFATDPNNSSNTKCLDRFVYDSNDAGIIDWMNLNGVSTGTTTGEGFSGPCTASTDSHANYPEGDVQLMLFDAWTVDAMRVACVDTSNHIIYLTGATKTNSTNYNYFGPTVNHRYIIENAKDAFVAAKNNGQTGIWYLDKSTTPGWSLYYIANSGETPSTDTVVIPQLGTTFPLSSADPTGGSLLSATGLSYVTFSGITFEVDNNTPVFAGFNTDDNGESAVPQAIDCESCQFVTFDGITVRHTSGTGLRVATAPSTVTCTSTTPCVQIQNSFFYDVGDDGIHIGHFQQGSDTLANVVHYVKVNNNFIQGFSRVFPDGEGLAEGNGHDITYINNDVNDGYHAGLSICNNGCTPIGVNGGNVVSSFNHIRNINQGITADGGTLYYNVGNQNGSASGDVINNNLVHDNTDSSIIDFPLAGTSQVKGSGYGGHGIYLDNQSAGFNVEYNVVYNTSGSTVWISTAPAQVSGWLPNTFISNIFAYGRLALFEESQPWPQVTTVSGCPTNPTPLANLTSNVFYFDLSDGDNLGNTIGFYVQQGCAYSCSAGSTVDYNKFQDYVDNDYWRTDGNFGTYTKAFHVYKTAPTNPSSCYAPTSTGAITTAWDFLTFAGWQHTVPPAVPLSVDEDTGGVVANPSFSATSTGCTSKVSNFCLSANPTTGFTYTQTNSTVTTAGSTLTAPAAVPGTFPTYVYSIAKSF